MAEFKMIMNGWKDICNHSDGCAECPIKKCDECYYVLEKLDENAIASIERTVLVEIPFWILTETGYECSACGCRSATQSKYCPDCGRQLLFG